MPQDNDQNNNTIYELYCDIDGCLCDDITLPEGNKLKNLQDLQERLKREQEINLLDKCGDQTLGGGVLNLAAKWGNSYVVKFLLQNINAEQSKLESKSEQYKEYQALKREAHDNAIEANKDRRIDKIVQLFAEYEKVSNAQESNEAQEKVKSQKNSSKDFYTSLGKDGVAAISTGALIAIAIMHPSTAFKAAFGALAALVAVGIGLHIKKSTVPSYVEMQKNSAELASQQERVHA